MGGAGGFLEGPRAPTILSVRRLLALAAVAALVPSTARAEETVRIAIVDGAAEITLAGKALEVRKLEAGEQYAPAPGGRSVVYLSGDAMMMDGAPVNDSDGVRFRPRTSSRSPSSRCAGKSRSARAARA